MALNKMLINQAYENMGLRTTQMLGTFFGGVTRHTEEPRQWGEREREIGTAVSTDGPEQRPTPLNESRVSIPPATPLRSVL